MTLLRSLSFLGLGSQHFGGLLLRRLVSLHSLRSLFFRLSSLVILGLWWRFMLLRLGFSLRRLFQLLLIRRVLSLWSWSFLLIAFRQILTSLRFGRRLLFLGLGRRHIFLRFGRWQLFLGFGWWLFFSDPESLGILQLSFDFSRSNLSLIIASSFCGSDLSLFILNKRRLLLGSGWLCLLIDWFGLDRFRRWRWRWRLLTFGSDCFGWSLLSLTNLRLAWFRGRELLTSILLLIGS